MAVNITVNTVGESVAVCYFQDGQTATVPVNSQKSVQLVERGFVTISDAVDSDMGEHPNNDLPENYPEFVDKMIAFWQGVHDKLHEND